MCYFPTGATFRICQSHVSGNDSERKDGKRGRSGRQRPDFTAKPWDQWIGRLCTPHAQTSAHTHVHTLTNTERCVLMPRLTYLEPVKKPWERHTSTLKDRWKHTNETLPPIYLTAVHSGCTSTTPPSPGLSSWRMDAGNCQLKWNSIWGVKWGGYIQWSARTQTHCKLLVGPQAGFHMCNTSTIQYYHWLHLWKLEHD